MRLITIVGARPQFIKAAVLSAEVARRGWSECLIHTGQHYDFEMSQVFFDQLALKKPDYHLGVGSASHGIQTGEMMQRLEPLLQAEPADWVIVYGDTNTTLAGALVAAKLGRPLAHVESGLRSFNREMPEEINRIVSDHLATLRFAPTPVAAANLRREGISTNVEVVGDLMVDLLHMTVRSLSQRAPVLDRFGLQPGSYAVATVHRASNTDDPERFRAIMAGLRRLGLPVVFPVHPRTAPLMRDERPGIDDNIIACEPLSYFDMVALQKDAAVILTDSGGMQKEAFALHVPCVTLRAETEWTETVDEGWNQLAGSDPDDIEGAARRPVPDKPPSAVYGDGRSAEKIADILLNFVGNPKPNSRRQAVVA